jgi:hypothetical protein
LIAMTTSWSTSATMDRLMANNSLQVRIFAPYANLYIAHKKWISIGISFLYLVSCFEIKGFTWLQMSINVSLDIWKCSIHLLFSYSVNKK